MEDTILRDHEIYREMMRFSLTPDDEKGASGVAVNEEGKIYAAMSGDEWESDIRANYNVTEGTQFFFCEKIWHDGDVVYMSCENGVTYEIRKEKQEEQNEGGLGA